jgi:hypothetical protein
VFGARPPTTALLLVAPTTPLPSDVASYLQANVSTITSIEVFGGTASLLDAVVTAVQAAS